MATIVKRGDMQWQAKVRRTGFPSQTKTFDTKAEAEDWAATIEASMVTGTFVDRRHLNDKIVRDLLQRYRAEVTPTKRGRAKEAIAGERLYPAQHIDLNGSTAVAAPENPQHEALGIVDPFLRKPVEPGERFWLVVMPRKITSLRHVWEHPSFPPSGATKTAPSKSRDEVKAAAIARMLEKGYSAGQIEAFAESVERHLGDGWSDEYLTIFGYDARGGIPADFWTDMEDYLGIEIPSVKRAEHFSCSC